METLQFQEVIIIFPFTLLCPLSNVPIPRLRWHLTGHLKCVSYERVGDD